MRLNQRQLTFRALQALEEAARDCEAGPLPKSQWLRFCLGYLHSVSAGDRAMFDAFWGVVTDRREGFSRSSDTIGRTQNANACLSGIYLAVGVQRTTEMIFHYNRKKSAPTPP